MLIEQEVESKIVIALAALNTGATIRGCRQGSPVEAVDNGQTIVVRTGIRQHDDFSLPTVNISGTIQLFTRAEMDADGDSHETALNALLTLLDGWHRDGAAMSSVLSTTAFFAAELRLEGGGGKDYDDDRAAWVEDFNFTIRGTVLESATNN